MAVNKVVYKHFEVKVSPAAAHAVDALLFGCGKINNDLNPDYNADLVNSVAFRASECKITRVVRKNADDESTVLYDGTPVNYFYLEYEPEDENDNGLFSITVKKTDGTDALKVVTVPYGTNRRPVYATQDKALRARMTQAEDDIDDLETKVDTIEQTTIPAINADVEALQANTLPKTGGEISGTLKIVGGIVAVALGEFTDMDTAGWNAIKDWYNALPKMTSALAIIQNNQGDSHGLGGGYIFLCTYKTDNRYGVIEATTYFPPNKRYCLIYDAVFSDFSVSTSTD